MSKATAYANAHKDDEEEKKVVGQQQKTQSQSSQPTGTTSIPKDNSRTQQSTASSLRTENNVTTAKQPQRETSKTTIYRQSDVPKQETKQTTMQSIKDYAKENYKLTPRQVSAKSNRIPDASALPTASEVMGSGFKQSNNLNQYITSGQKFTPQTNSRQRAEEEFENRLHNRDQLRNVGNTNTFKSLLSGAGAGALGTIGDLAGLAEKMSQNKSTEGMTPDEIYNRAMNTGRSWDNVYGNNIGSDYEAYKEYVLKQMESGAVTQDELRKMQDLEDKYSKNPAHYLSELGKDARAMNEGYSEGHKISNVAGQMIPMLLGNFAVGAVTAPEIAAAEAINNPAVRFAAQQGINLLPDVATDTIPEVLRNINEGKSADEVAKDAAKNLALNEAANLGFEYLPKGIKALADQANASNMAKRAVNTVPDVVEPMVKQTPVEEAAEQIVKAAETPKNVDNVVKAATDANSLPNANAEIPTLEAPSGDLPKGDTNIPTGGTTPPNRGPKDPLVDTNDVKERGYARTTRNNPDVPDELAAEFVETPELYNVLHNKETRANADAVLSQDFDKAYSDFKDMLNRKDPTAIPVGYDLAKKMIDKGDVDGAAELIRDMSRELTKAGQFSQAAAMTIMRGDPMTALRYAEKEIDSLNAAGAKKFGSKWKDFKLTEDEIKAFNNLNAGDTEGISKLYSQIGTRLGKDYPTTFLDKLLEARRIGMLFNPRTNIRNFAANVPTLALRWASDRVDAVGQNIAHIIKPDFEVTQSLTGSGIKGRKMAKEIFEGDKVQSLLKGTSGKYKDANIKSSLIQEKQMFKGTGLEKWIDKMTGNGLQRLNAAAFGKNGVQSIPETIRNATYKALDLGDSPFVKENFIERLGSYIKAQGYKSVDEIPDEAIETAWEAAMKATYKDESWAYKMIRDIKQGIQQAGKPGKVIGESLIPFVQAPGNIAARMVDYSPIGGINGIKNILNGAKNGNEKIVREGINQLAQGATGSLALGIGVALYNSGLITGAYSQDKDKKAHEKNNGFREYALHIGNNYYTLDWAQPAFQTIMNGVVLADAIKKSDEYDSEILKAFGVEGSLPGKLIGASKKAATTSVNSWFNASPLQSVQELLGGTYNDASDIAAKLWETVGEDFVNSYVPAALNAFTKATDLTQRQTYDPSNAIRSEINQLKANIPGLSETLPAKYDTWGRELKTAESHGKAAFNKFINPGEGTYDKSEPIDKEINRLFDETGNNSVYPQVAPNKLGNDKLTAEQVSALQRSMGEKAYEVANELINDKNYKSFSDDVKANSFKQLYDATNALAKLQISDPETYKKIMAGDEDAIANNLDGLTRVYAEGGAKGLIDEITYKNVLKKTGMNDNDKARQIYESAKSRYDAEQKLYDLRHYQDWYKAEGFSKSTDRLESIYNSDASEEEKLNELKNYSAFKDISEEMDIGESGAREEIFNELGEEGYREFADIYKKAQEASGLKADGSKQLTNAGAIKALKDLPSEQQEKYAPYLITNPGKNASQAQKDYPNGLYKYYMYKNEADKDGNGSVSSDESKAYFNSKSMPQGEKAYWDMSIRGSNKSNFGIPTLGNASTSTTSSTKLKETGDATLDARIKSKQNWKNNQASLDAAKNQSSTDIPTAGVDKNWYVESGGQTYDLHSTKTYERAKSAGISDDEFLKAFKGADIDGNGKIKKSEATAYINALTNLTKEQKRTWFDVLVTRKSKNPY